MKKRMNKFMMILACTAVFVAVLLLTVEVDKNGNWKFASSASYATDIGGEANQYDSKTVTLLAPPGYATLAFDGNQAVSLTVKNNNFFIALVSVTPNYGNYWSMSLPPYGSNSKTFDVFANVPVGWSFSGSVTASAASLAMTATWKKWQ